MNGKITWYNDKMGFGFIASPAGGNRLFFDTDNPSLFSVEQEVEYDEVVNSRNGRPCASNVKPVSPSKQW